ncbi:MAG: alpha/beta hydrolase [Lachnospiraceae bacterium]|nr:alpha/beta hydrolase [Lachnospiraceae bacterium]MBQ6993539.1 alpha/beta hydrolase [Lachnospiraceae bacterium]
MLECMLGAESMLKMEITCPTLVFKTLHDRYFPKEYFDCYYASLQCEKKLVEINDTHNSYFIHPEPFMREIASWVESH